MTMRHPGEYGLLVLIPLISIVGALGNFIVLTFYLKRAFSRSSGGSSMQSITSTRVTANTFILVLSANDFIASIVVMPLTLIYELAPTMMFTSDFACKFYFFITTSVIPFSAFLIIAISVDRFFCIIHPLKVILTPVRAAFVVVVLAVIASIMGMLVAINFSVGTASDGSPGRTLARSGYNSSGVNGNSSSSLNSLLSRLSGQPFSSLSTPRFGSINEIAIAAHQSKRLMMPTTAEVYYTTGAAKSNNNNGKNGSRLITSPSPSPPSIPMTTTFSILSYYQLNKTGFYAIASAAEAELMCVRVPVLGDTFQEVYHHIHNAIIFGLALTVPFAIYAVIYVRLFSRQRDRARRKSATSRVLLECTSNTMVATATPPMSQPSMPHITLTRPSNEQQLGTATLFATPTAATTGDQQQRSDRRRTSSVRRQFFAVTIGNDDGDDGEKAGSEDKNNNKNTADAPKCNGHKAHFEDDANVGLLSDNNDGADDNCGNSNNKTNKTNNNASHALTSDAMNGKRTSLTRNLRQQLEQLHEDSESDEKDDKSPSPPTLPNNYNRQSTLPTTGDVGSNNNNNNNSHPIVDLSKKLRASVKPPLVSKLSLLSRFSTTSISTAAGVGPLSNGGSRVPSGSSSVSFRMGGERASQVRLAVMLFVVTVVFALSYVPAFLANYTSLFGESAWSRFAFYIYFVNNAANPIIYGVMNRNFREELLKSCLTC